MGLFASTSLISSGDMSASFQSEGINLHLKKSYSIIATFTGSPGGSLYLAYSIDGINWYLLPDSTSTISAAGDVSWLVSTAHYSWVRMHWAKTGGTGTLNATYNTKGVF